jgi:hypothetical protein
LLGKSACGFLEREDIRVAHMHPIIKYVPIAVVQDDDIGSRQIDAEATTTCCQQEDELVAAGFFIFVDTRDTIVVCSPTVNTTVFCKDGS